MPLPPSRWHVIAESSFPWEREALAFLREHLPDRHPWHVWTNFEYIDDEGRVSEVDALVLSPAGLFLVEIKSRPGTLTGDAHTWTWSTDGRRLNVDNPLLLADRKAKRLASLLRRQPAITRARLRLPFVEPVVFLSSASLDCRLDARARTGAFLRGRPGTEADDGIVAALTNGARGGFRAPIDANAARPISRALTEAGIRTSNRHRTVGDYRLIRLLSEGEDYQDWLAGHVSMERIERRIRIYGVASATSPEERATRQRMARREFEILEGVHHAGILSVHHYQDTDLGPALVFDHDPEAMRLDHLILERGANLTIDQQLQLLRAIAEVLQFAHGRRLYHRALGPQSVLVAADGNGGFRVRLMNWQTAARNASVAGTRHRTTGTRHVEAYVDDPDLVYLAPETLRADPADGASLDVFSLGCLAYLIFTGHPPAATTLDMTEKLRAGPGLRLSDQMDNCSGRLQDLVQFATAPEVITRTESVREFLDELDGVLDELTTPDPEATVDPSVANPDERLQGGFTVRRRLGRGSSSDALLVQADEDGGTWVLKVANAIGHNDNLRAEGEALEQLRHPNIVGWKRTLEIGGRTALLLHSAGDRTLAQKLKADGRLSLDLLQRFGEELLDAVRHLEDKAVVHRDIKPDNIGISDARSGKLQLVLFDFSLCRTPPENLSAGTHPYLDPFLPNRPRKRWDLYAERFAAAVTLYEMAVGTPPRWSDGQTSPALLDVEATIDGDLFDPVTREGLVAFFTQALRRDYRARFDNAEDMLRAWRAAFTTRHPVEPQTEEAFEAIARAATAGTTMAELGYSLEAQDALERLRVHNVRALLAVNRVRFRYLRGVGDKVRREIRLKAKALARLRPDLAVGGNPSQPLPDDGRTPTTVDELAGTLLPRRSNDDARPEDDALAHYLGLDPQVAPGHWPTPGEVALAAHITRAAVADALSQARERWLRLPAITDVRAELDALLASQGNVLTLPEAAQALLGLRGCVEQDEGERRRQACAVVRAAVEAETARERPRFTAFDLGPATSGVTAQASPGAPPQAPLIATRTEWATYARQLGAAADACALEEPLLPPGKVLQLLDAVPLPVAPTDDGAAATPTPARLLRLACSASTRAALSSRQEIYARDMPAALALRQSLGALVGADNLSPDDITARVQGRYPEAAPLPPRPQLDALLAEVGAPLTWDPAANSGRGAYRRRDLARTATAGTTTVLQPPSTHSGGAGGAAQGVPDAGAARFIQRLQRSLDRGGLMVLTVPPRLAVAAETALLRQFAPADGTAAVRRLNVDALMLSALRAAASAAGADWAKVLEADAADRSSRDWQNLLRLVQRTVPALRSALFGSAEPLLVTNAGLLARYDLLSLIGELEANVGRPGQTPTAWLLLPAHQEGQPTIDGVAVPLVNATAVLPVPQGWAHPAPRAATTA